MTDIKVCPRCGSTDLKRRHPLDGRKIGSISGAGTRGSDGLDIFVCQQCGYTGTCPVIDEKDILKFKEELRNLDSD